MSDLSELANRYVAVWNEADADLRRDGVEELWSEDGVQRVQAPEEMRERAAALAMNTALEVRGHRELAARVGRAYDEFVAPGEFVFRRRDDVMRVGDVVKFRWDMVRREGGDTAAVGSSSSCSITTAGSGSITSSSRPER